MNYCLNARSLATSLCSAPRRPCRRYIATQAGISARWCIDIRYGMKLDAVSLMQEWVRDVGSQAGLTTANARINSGAVGIPESRLELEVEFNSFAELEEFWASIPPDQHRAWSQRMQNLVVHGSPTWEVYRTVPLLTSEGEEGQQLGSSPAPAIIAAGSSDSSGSSGIGSGAGSGRKRSGRMPGSSGLLQQPSPEEIQGLSLPQDDAEVILDWKGEPMKINPKDKLPFRFL